MINTHLELSYLYGGVVQYRAGDQLSPRILPDYELVLILDGQVTYDLNGTPHPAPPGTVILARPGFREHYQWDPNASTRHAYLHFDVEHNPTDWPPVENWVVLNSTPHPLLPQLFRHTVSRASGHPEWPSVSPDPDTCRLVATMISLHIRPPDTDVPTSQHLPEAVHLAMNHMRLLLDSNPHAELSLNGLAQKSSVTGQHLCRLFQKHVGHPPLKTYRLFKMQLAMAILGRSTLAIKEVADRCGFDNPLYFSRCFSQTYGMSPREARIALKNKQPPPPNPLPPDLTPRIYW
jgi:AraC-like DNA-binding protein